MQLANLISDIRETGRAPCGDCAVQDCAFRKYMTGGAKLRRLHMARGDRMECNQKDCLRFWIVVTGTAATCTSFADGRRQIASLETEGNILCGPMATYGSEHWLEALSDVAICEVDMSPEASKLKGNAEFLNTMFNMTHSRLEDAYGLLAMLGRLDSRERVTLFLAERAWREGGGARNVVSLQMSREDIADYLGLNTETVSRVFTRIRKSGLIKFLSPTEYMIPDFDAVARYLPVAIPGHQEGYTQ